MNRDSSMVKRWLPICGLIVFGVLLCVVFLIYTTGNGTKEDRAKFDIKTLRQSVDTYYAKNSKWPETLEVLAQSQPDGGPPLMSEKNLKDPWGRPYQYDPAQLHTRTEQPLIWSEGPNPGQPGSKITNWD